MEHNSDMLTYAQACIKYERDNWEQFLETACFKFVEAVSYGHWVTKEWIDYYSDPLNCSPPFGDMLWIRWEEVQRYSRPKNNINFRTMKIWCEKDRLLDILNRIFELEGNHNDKEYLSRFYIDGECIVSSHSE